MADNDKPTLARFPWQAAIARIILGVFGAVIAGGGIVHLLRDFFGKAAEANHSDWVSFATVALGTVLLILALDFQNRMLEFLKGLPLPAWLKGAKGGGE